LSVCPRGDHTDQRRAEKDQYRDNLGPHPADTKEAKEAKEANEANEA
jgi:hypothetical protein